MIDLFWIVASMIGIWVLACLIAGDDGKKGDDR